MLVNSISLAIFNHYFIGHKTTKLSKEVSSPYNL